MASRAEHNGIWFGLPEQMLGQAPNVFWLSPAIPWTCCATTVASAIYLHWKLEAATEVAVKQQSQSSAEMAVVLS